MAQSPRPAPIDRAELELVLDPDSTGTMLPRTAYVDPEVLAWEQDVLFGHGWVCAGRSDDLAEPGMQQAVTVGDEGVLLVRGKDGVLRGFSNACRHRAHELLPCGPATLGKAIVCPYHAWVYDFDGSLRGIPPLHREDVPDRTPLSLNSVRIEEWQGFVMVNLSGDAQPLADHFFGLDEIFDRYSCSSLSVAASHSYELETNWKLIVENYHECFHCASIHPELCRVSSPLSGDSMMGRGFLDRRQHGLLDGNETMALDGKSHGVPIPSVPVDRLTDVIYLQVTPNLLVSLHPDYVMTHRMEPVTASRTKVECQWLFPKEAFDLPGLRPVLRGGLLGPHEPAGLDGVRIRPAGSHDPVLHPRSVLELPRDRRRRVHPPARAGYLDGEPLVPVPFDPSVEHDRPLQLRDQEEGSRS